MFKSINVKKLLLSLVIPYIAGFLSWLLSRNQMEVYSGLNQPPFAPPGWVFPIVWAILYFLMGLSLYNVASASVPQQKKSFAYIVFGLQLFFNFAWTVIFFTLGMYTLAAVWLGILILLIVLNIAVFGRISKPAAYLLLPYLLWCIFALYLNIGVALLN